MYLVKPRKVVNFSHIFCNTKYEFLQLIMEGKCKQKRGFGKITHGLQTTENGSILTLMNYLEPHKIKIFAEIVANIQLHKYYKRSSQTTEKWERRGHQTRSFLISAMHPLLFHIVGYFHLIQTTKKKYKCGDMDFSRYGISVLSKQHKQNQLEKQVNSLISKKTKLNVLQHQQCYILNHLFLGDSHSSP